MRSVSGCRRFQRRPSPLLAVLALAMIAAIRLAGGAEAATRQPPHRPDQFIAPPAATEPATQPPPPAAPSQPPPTGRAPVDVDVDKLQPFNLPPASRERMRKCGEEWRDLKMAGKSRGLVWRSFAEQCLAR